MENAREFWGLDSNNFILISTLGEQIVDYDKTIINYLTDSLNNNAKLKKICLIEKRNKLINKESNIE